ncbi:hypothetical protein KKG72_10420 [bacterium]|nr:hypothetical protein [bacterium]MBU1994464.1 hypothetical protein [bacterium]
MWLNKLKIAIIEKNIDSINKLLDEIPELSNMKDIEESIYLLREAAELMYTLQDEVSLSMKKIQKNLSFLRSTDIPTSRRLDIKS